MGDNNNDGFTINVNSPGNFIAKEITFTGTVNIGNGNTDYGGYTDEQIAQAITAINGAKKPLNSKRKWAAVHWCLRKAVVGSRLLVSALVLQLPDRCQGVLRQGQGVALGPLGV